MSDSVEDTEPSGFLSDDWRDVLAVCGGVGVIITAVAFLLALHQVSRATSVAEASSKAAVEVLNESRRKHDRYLVSRISRLLNEVSAYVRSGEWRLASVRLLDLAELVSQISDGDARWDDLAGRLGEMEEWFERVGNSGRPCSTSLRGKWRKLRTDLSSKITETDRPFPPAEKEPKP
ncbi:MAG: hypothetical protein NTW96_21190 [Planctomycetia bacterium]|nr:hypothetical protein [Planctomycetia bacterium]